MKVQLDRFEDSGWAVLLLGRRSFDVPRELLPPEVRPGDVIEFRPVIDREESERRSAENRRLMDELLGKDGAS